MTLKMFENSSAKYFMRLIKTHRLPEVYPRLFVIIILFYDTTKMYYFFTYEMLILSVTTVQEKF